MTAHKWKSAAQVYKENRAATLLDYPLIAEPAEAPTPARDSYKFSDSSELLEQPPQTVPEINLLAAMIESAHNDMLWPVIYGIAATPGRRALERWNIRRATKRWLCDNSTVAFSFRWVCEHLFPESETIYQSIRKGILTKAKTEIPRLEQLERERSVAFHESRVKKNAVG